MAIQGIDQLAAAQLSPLANANISKTSMTTVANRWQSMFVTGGSPATGVAPTTSAIPTKATAGALVNFPALTGGLTGYVDLSALTNSVANTHVIIYDRLSACGGLNGTTLTAQGSVSVPDRGDVTNYTNVVAFLEVYTAIGATPQTATISYLNGTNTGGARSAAVSIPANMAAGNVLLFPLQAGDQSVRSITSVTLSGSTGTAGNFGLTLARPIAAINVPVVGALQPNALSAMGQFVENACLWAVVIPPSTASGIVQGQLKLIQG